MLSIMRRTRALTKVALALMERPADQHYGYELAVAANVRAGSLYPILTRMLESGWVSDGWEDPSVARAEKRPPRRYYVLTGSGRAALSGIICQAEAELAAKRSVFDRMQPEVGQ